MDHNRLRKLAGLVETEIKSEIKRASLERTTENEESPDFSGILSDDNETGGNGFEFLKTLGRKKIEEDGPENTSDAEDEMSERAIDAYLYDLGFETIQTSAVADSTFVQFLNIILDSTHTPAEDTSTLDSWVEVFQDRWHDDFEDLLVNDAGGNIFYDDANREYDYYDLSVRSDVRDRYAAEFAKWAQLHNDTLVELGFSEMPAVQPEEFAQRVAGKITEHGTDLGLDIQ